MLNYLLTALLAYLIGNFSPSFLCGKTFGKIDIREFGSGNTGATNVIRVMGWRYGVVVFILDIIKCVIAVALGSWFAGSYGGLLAAVFVVIGHDFPVFLGFRGGKGIASSFGVFLVLFPRAALMGFALFFLVVLLTRMVSVGSLSFVSFVFGYVVITSQSPPAIAVTGGLALLAFIRHSENLRRVFSGTENKLSLAKVEPVE